MSLAISRQQLKIVNEKKKKVKQNRSNNYNFYMSLFSSLEPTVKAAYAASFSKKKKEKKRREKRLREKDQNRRIKTSNKENDWTPLKVNGSVYITIRTYQFC